MKKERNKKKPISIIIKSVVIILLMEVISLCILFTNELFQKTPDEEIFLANFALTRPLSLFVKPSEKMVFLKNARQKNIGNVSPMRMDKWRELFPTDSILGWRLAKNIKCTHHNAYVYVTNDQGFMSIGETDFHYNPDKPKDVYRIIVVGGSTVFGVGAYTPVENLPCQIYTYLQKIQPRSKSKVKYEVINAGVGGYASGQEYLYIMTDLVKYHPDLIIVYDGWNDQVYNNALISRFGKNVNPYKSETHYALEQRLNQSYRLLGSFSMFCGLAKSYAYISLYQTGTMTLLNRLKNRNNARKARQIDYYPESTEIYRDNLMKMIMLAKLHHFKIAIFLQPLMGVDGKILTPEETKIFGDLNDLTCKIQFYEHARQMLKDLKNVYADDKDVYINDLSRSFANITETIYADAGHLLLRGNQIIAKNIIETLNLQHADEK